MREQHEATSEPKVNSNTDATYSKQMTSNKAAFPLIVIGASAGGLDAITKLTDGLPKDLGAAVCIVWHMSADVRGILPQLINNTAALTAANAYDGELIVPNRIYVAPPDRHMLIENGYIRVTRGPKENRFRPAVDPLFRSAAYTYGNKVIGIVLSGALDDGTAGLWTVKHHGGIAIVQDLQDAQVPSMPENAMREVSVDYVTPVAEMPFLLMRLVKELSAKPEEEAMKTNKKERTEISIAADDNPMKSGIMELGDPSVFTCPECHGVLMGIKEGSLKRFRCHTGHAFSPDSLLAALSENIEESLWNAVRSIEESTMLLNHIGDHFAEINQPKLAAMYFKKAQEADKRTEMVRQVVLQHEQLSKGSLEQEAAIEKK